MLKCRSLLSSKSVITIRRIAALAALTLQLAYTSPADAATSNCLAVILVEISNRSFQVSCSNGPADGTGGVPTWLTYSAGTDAQAARFQSLVLATVLAGRKLRVDASASTTGLCAGIGDCAIISWWALWN